MTEKLKNWSSISTTVIAVVAAFYSQIAPFWGLPFEHEITGTLTALATAIAGVLGAFTLKKVIDTNNNGVPDDEENTGGQA